MTGSLRIKRILELCDAVHTVADIGADHGRTSVGLLELGLAQQVIATDISAKSIAKAQRLFAQRKLASRADCRVGDGMQVLQPGEAQGIIISGMGGQMILHILQARPQVVKRANWLVISPQSNIDLVRRTLPQMDLCILEEDIVLEDGKYYPLLKIAPGIGQAYTEQECYTGKPERMRSKQRFFGYMDYMIDKFQTIVQQATDSPDLPRLKQRLEMYLQAAEKGKQL